MRTYHDGYHNFPREMLYDLGADPHEQRNVASEHPDVCDRAAHLLLDWFDENMCSSQTGVDPMQTVLREGGPFHTRGHLAEYAEFLRRTDRAEEADRLIARHPDEL